jgi:hypothetical protein
VKTKVRNLTVVGVLLLCGFAYGQKLVTSEGEPLASDLQKESFSSLSWELAEFRVGFAHKFQEQLLALQQARKQGATDTKPALDNSQLAEVLEDTIAQAERALPVDELKECLLNFYRAASLTNKFLTLRAELERTNPNRAILSPEKAFLNAIAQNR